MNKKGALALAVVAVLGLSSCGVSAHHEYGYGGSGGYVYGDVDRYDDYRYERERQIYRDEINRRRYAEARRAAAIKQREYARAREEAKRRELAYEKGRREGVRQERQREREREQIARQERQRAERQRQKAESERKRTYDYARSQSNSDRGTVRSSGAEHRDSSERSGAARSSSNGRIRERR